MRFQFVIGLVVVLAISTTALTGCGQSAGPATPTGTTPVATASSTTTTTTTVPAATTTTSVSAPRPLRQASFESANGYLTEGTARIVRLDDEFSLELLSDFRTSQSPGLDVRLCNDMNCRSGAQLDLGELKKFSKKQLFKHN